MQFLVQEKNVDSFIRGGNTATVCSIDLSKAFNKVNHHLKIGSLAAVLALSGMRHGQLHLL